MVTFRRTYQVKFVSGRFEYNLLLTTDKEVYEELEKEVKDYMRKTYKISNGEVIIISLKAGIIEL